MLGIGLSELIIIGVLALIFIGPQDLPKVAAQIARFINDLKRSTESFKKEFTWSQNDPPKKPYNTTSQKPTNPQSEQNDKLTQHTPDFPNIQDPIDSKDSSEQTLKSLQKSSDERGSE